MKKTFLKAILALAASFAFVFTSCSHESSSSGGDPVAVESVEINQSDFQLAYNKTRQLTATVLPADATNKTVTWTSSDVSVATVDPSSGLVTALPKTGKATITATAGSQHDEVEVTVSETVTFGSQTKTYTVAQLGLTGIVAESDDEDVATVSDPDEDGKVTITSEGPGETTITVTDATGNTATIVVKVEEDGSITQISLHKYEPPVDKNVPVTGVMITGASNVAKGKSATLRATVTPSNATNKAVTWSCETEGVTVTNGIVTVSDDCTVTEFTVRATSAADSTKFDERKLKVIDISSISEGITITEEKGWLESAYIKWSPVTNEAIDGYNVYVQAADGEYEKLDDMLVRAYSNTPGGTTTDYYRADALGLAEGTYQMKVVGKVGDAEAGDVRAASNAITVEAHDRSGFAFTGSTTPGAYNKDGTLKDNAVVLYLTDENKDTVSLTVTTSSKGATTKFTGIQNILNGYKKGYETKPLAIRMIGNVRTASSADKGDLVIENDNKTTGITFEGVGDDATANEWGIRVKNASYIEIRNIGFVNCSSDEGDNIGLQQNNDHVWVHNCDMFYGDAGSDADQVKGDGALDCKGSNYVTFSYNHFWDNGKCNLLGLKEEKSSTDSDAYYITYHHNWYDHSDSRHPRVRFYNAHIYNNYYDGNAKYGAGSTRESSLFMESNYFRNCQYPMLISLQGSDVFAGSTAVKFDNGTFSKESGGIIKAYGNYMTGNYTFIPYGADKYILKGNEVKYNLTGTDATSDFDAYVVSNRNERVPETVTANSKTVSLGGKIDKGTAGNHYSNFDTASGFYTYKPDTPEDAKANVEKYAGRMNGGDLKWDFNDAVEDTNYIVIDELKSLVTNYKSCLVKVMGSSSAGGGDGDGDDPSSGGGDTGSSGGTTGGTTTETVTLTDADYPTTALKAGTYSNGFSTIGFKLVKATGSSSAINTNTIDVYSGDYLTFYVDKACNISTTQNIGNKGCKVVRSDGTVIKDMGANTGAFSVSLAAGKYFITTGSGVAATAYTRIKNNIVITYTE